MYKWLFHEYVTIFNKTKTIYTNEMSMICRNTNRNDYFPIMRIPCDN